MFRTTGVAKTQPDPIAVAELVGLLGLTAEGDHKAFRRLYDLTQRKLFGVAFLILKQRDNAEDALQEAYIRIWTKAGTYDPEKGTPLPWLARIVRNVALDRVRQKSVWTNSLDDHHDTAAEAPVSTLAIKELNKCLATMQPNQRAAWWMIHLDGLSREEVALRMKIPLGTVKSWVFRSSKRIRTAVDS